MLRVFRRYRVLWLTPGIIVLGIAIVAANFLSSTYYERYDLTAGGAYSLSGDTERILGNLDREATLHFFPLPDHVNHGPHARRNRRLITDLLREYTARTDHLSLRLIPPAQFPDRVRALASQHGVDEQQLMQREPVLITVDGSEKHRVIPFDTLRVIRSGSGDRTASGSGASVSYARAERAITSSLVALTRSTSVTVGFMHSSGDADTVSSGGASTSFSVLRSVLSERDGFDVREDPRSGSTIVADLDVLVLSHGTEPVNQVVGDALRAYLERGGSVIVLAEPDASAGFTSLFREYGVNVTDVAVSSPPSPVPGAPPEVERLDGYRSHAITDPVREAEVPVFMRGMRVVTKTDRSVPGRETSVLLGAVRSDREPPSDPGAGETNYLLTDGGLPVVPVAVASEPARTGDDGSSGRLLVFGDADWVQDGLLASVDRIGTGANLPLFRNAVRWSAGLDHELRFIPDRGGRSPFVVTEEEAAAVFTLVVVLLPGCALLLGVMIWWFRRMRT